jgi:hypothetical protein
MLRPLWLAATLVAAPANAAETVRVFGEDMVASWARCPFALFMAQRRANHQLELDLDGKIVLTGSAAPRVEYAVKLGRSWLRVRVGASGKSLDFSKWYVDTITGSAHELQLDGPGLAASIQATDLASPLVTIFKAAVEECMGAKPAAPSP